MELVDPDVTQRKFERELELWSENVDIYRRRGWLTLARRELAVDVAFLARLPLSAQVIPTITACVRIDFTNYDLWAPGVEFIDPFSGDYAPPTVQAIIDSEEGPRDLLVQNHPLTGRPFFCVAGIREYHDHPQHSGDSWLLHRSAGAGRLATICDVIWRTMARNLVGVRVQLQTLPGQAQLDLRLASAPGEVAPIMWDQVEETRRQAERAAQAQAEAGVPGPGSPSQVLAALGVPSPPAPGVARGARQ
jgi:hypothetical protein